MKKKLAYFLVTSDNIAFAAGNVALSLNKYMPNKEYDILVYHSDLQEKNLKTLKKIPHVITHHFRLNDDFVSYMLGENGLPKNGRWNDVNSLLCLAHYEIFSLLDSYEKVIWLDVDMSIQADITLLETYGPFGMALDIAGNHVFTAKDQFLTNVEGYDLSQSAHISACIVVTDKLKNYKEIYQYCYEKTKIYASILKNPDQAIIELAIRDFGLTVNNVPWKEFVCHSTHEYAALASIVHFGFINKPWNNSRLLQSFPEWFRTHLVWLSLGGADFNRDDISTCSVYVELQKLENKLCEQMNSENYKAANSIRWCLKELKGLIIQRIKERRIGKLHFK